MVGDFSRPQSSSKNSLYSHDSVVPSIDITAWKKWLGVGLIGLSGVWFVFLLLVPFTPFSLAIRGGMALSFLVLMEVSFWLGTLIVGKQVVSRYWRSIKARIWQKPGDGGKEHG